MSGAVPVCAGISLREHPGWCQLLRQSSAVYYEIDGTTLFNVAEVPCGAGIYYHCLHCQTIVPSLPAHLATCSCMNIYTDPAMSWFDIGDFDRFRIIVTSHTIDGERSVVAH